MPLYDLYCDKCKGIEERLVQAGSAWPECCGEPLKIKPAPIAYIHMKGQGYPSRRKWMENWAPDGSEKNSKFPTVSVHGEKK